MLRGVEWHFPGKAELLRCVPASAPQAMGPPGTGNQGNLRKTRPAPEKRHTVALTLVKTPAPAVYRSNRDKARDVETALRADPARSNRKSPVKPVQLTRLLQWRGKCRQALPLIDPTRGSTWFWLHGFSQTFFVEA
jgi:hypothetical protein